MQLDRNALGNQTLNQLGLMGDQGQADLSLTEQRKNFADDLEDGLRELMNLFEMYPDGPWPAVFKQQRAFAQQNLGIILADDPPQKNLDRLFTGLFNHHLHFRLLHSQGGLIIA